MKLYELFDRKDYKWVDKRSDYWLAEFDVNGINYSIICDKQDGWLYQGSKIDLWDLSFVQSDNSLTSTKTGTGNEMSIFSNAINAFEEFLNNVCPSRFTISCTSKEPNRIKLYNSIIKKLENRLKPLSYTKTDKVFNHEIAAVNNHSNQWHTINFEKKNDKK